MRSEPIRTTVAKLQAEGALLVEDGNHGEYRPRPDEFTERGVAFIRATDMSAGRIQFDTASKINDVAVARIRKGVGLAGDILLSHKGTVGKLAMAPADAPAFVCSPQTTFWRVLDAGRIDPNYLFAYLRSPEFHAQLDSRKGETDMADYVSLTAQRELVVPLPGIVEQRAIGDTVGMLDERLGLLSEMSASLQRLVQAIFASWFIDFDLVRAKVSGFEPEGIEPQIAAMFPNEFEDSALGPLPRGWAVSNIGHVCENVRAQARPSQLPNDTAYVGLEHMPRRSLAMFDVGTTAGLESNKFWYEPRDLLFGKLRPYFHKVGLAPDRGVCSTDILVMRPRTTGAHAFVAMHAFSDALIDYTTRLSNGAKMPRTSWQDIAAFQIALPPDNLIFQFNDLVGPMLERIRANVVLFRSLVELRDSILPRLISGKVRVVDPNEEVEEAIA